MALNERMRGVDAIHHASFRCRAVPGSVALCVMDRKALMEEELTRSIIGAFYRVYNELGFGFLEHLYLSALERDLRSHGLHVAREMSVRVMYGGEELGMQRLDMVVDEIVVVEAKSTRGLPDIAARQLYNYLRSTKYEVGLLLHFGPKPQFHRSIYENHLKRGQ